MGLVAATVYFVALGGGSAGEQLTAVRALNAAIGAALVLLYTLRLRRDSDAVDAAVLIGLLCFTVAALFSSNQRQSFDSVVQALAYGALFWYARGRLATPAGYSGLAWAFGVLLIGLTLFFAIEWGGVWLDWARLTDFTEVPPLSLPLPAVMYLHRHDVALLIVMLAPVLLIPIGFGRLRALRLAAVPVILGVLLIDGSRAVIAGAVLAGAIAAALAIRQHGPIRTRVRIGFRIPGRAVAAVLAIVAIGAAIGLGPPVMERLLNTETLGARGQLWSGAFQMWFADPLTGSGPGTYLLALFDTGYYDSNVFFPRNTDGALQLVLAESGLLGIVALAIPAIAIVRTGLARSRPLGVLLFGPLAFVFTGIGSVPADFAYLVVVAVLWLAAACPRVAPEPAERRTPATPAPLRLLRPASVGAAALIGLAMAGTVVAGFAYEDARRALAAGAPAQAARSLRGAVSWDPHFALYWRTLGASLLSDGSPGAAAAALRTASIIEPRDPVTARLLATAHLEAGQMAEAEAAAERAVTLQGTEPLNRAIAAYVASSAGEVEVAQGHVDHIIVRHPWLLAAEWDERLSQPPTLNDAASILDRWAGSDRDLGLTLEPAWLEGLTGADRHREAVDLAAAGLPASRRALEPLFGCETQLAASHLAAADISERAQASYWAVQIMVDRVLNADPSKHIELGRITGLGRGVQDTVASSPLAEMWVYRRLPLPAVPMPVAPPSGEAAFREWLRDPVASAAAAGLSSLAQCRG